VANRYLLIVKKFHNDSFIFYGVIKKKFRPRAKMIPPGPNRVKNT